MSTGGRGWRIAYVSGSPRIGTSDSAQVTGPRAHILGLIEALREDGHVVEQFVLGDHLDAGRLGPPRSAQGAWPRQVAADVVRLGLRPSIARRAAGHLPGPFDVVYERYALFQEVGPRVRTAPAPWVVETNAVMAQEARQERSALALQRLAARLERRSYRRADLVVCVSDRLRDLLAEQADVPLEKIAVIPNAVDVRRFRPAAVTAGDVAGPDELVIGFVGIVVARQGLEELVRAVASVRRSGARIRAVVVGEGPERRRLEELADRLGVAEAVEFRGAAPWSAVPGLISTFSVGYSGQRGVGGMQMYHSPLKIYEYLAVGRPVVAAAHPDAERTLNGASAGWTFPAGDSESLADLLTQLADMPRDRLSAAGVRGREHVEQHHTWRHRSRQLAGELRGRSLIG